MGAVVEHGEEDELHESVRVEQPPEVHDHPHGRRLDGVVLLGFVQGVRGLFQTFTVLYCFTLLYCLGVFEGILAKYEFWLVLATFGQNMSSWEWKSPEIGRIEYYYFRPWVL